MSGNSFGRLFVFTSFGESHSDAIGGVIEGFPSGVELDFDFIASELNRRRPQSRTSLRFLTPTAFKQSGRYTIFPQEKLILQSLFARWNEVFPEYPLNDEDAFQALLSGIHITDYKLRTSRFLLKGVKIPGFLGSCTLDAKLPLPLLELWNTLLLFSGYSGIGIKTGLGMGGAESWMI